MGIADRKAQRGETLPGFLFAGKTPGSFVWAKSPDHCTSIPLSTFSVANKCTQMTYAIFQNVNTI